MNSSVSSHFRGSRNLSGTLLSVCTPCYNESAHIKQLIKKWCAELDDIVGVGNYEIVVGDDASCDNTPEILLEMSESFPIAFTRLESNEGPGSALRAAIAASVGKYVLLNDSDGQYSISEFLKSPCIGRRLRSSVDSNSFVFGVRSSKTSSVLHRIGSKTFSRLERKITGVELADYNCAIKLLPGEWARNQKPRANGFNYSFEWLSLAVKSGGAWEVLDISSYDRESGISKLKILRDGSARVLFLSYLLMESILTRKSIIDV